MDKFIISILQLAVTRKKRPAPPAHPRPLLFRLDNLPLEHIDQKSFHKNTAPAVQLQSSRWNLVACTSLKMRCCSTNIFRQLVSAYSHVLLQPITPVFKCRPVVGCRRLRLSSVAAGPRGAPVFPSGASRSISISTSTLTACVPPHPRRCLFNLG